MIEIDQLSFDYRTFSKEPGLKGALQDIFHRKYQLVPALKDLNLTIKDGEIINYTAIRQDITNKKNEYDNGNNLIKEIYVDGSYTTYSYNPGTNSGSLIRTWDNTNKID